MNLPSPLGLDGLTDLRPTSPIQRGSLAIAPGSASRGLLNWVYQFNGRVDVVALSAAIDQVVDRHEVLRTRFVGEGDDLRQASVPFRPGILQVRDGEGPDRGARLEKARAEAEETYTGLDAVGDTELQATLTILEPKRSLLALFLGEALVDGQSAVFVAREIAATYCERTGQEVPRAMGGSDKSFLDYVTDNPVPQDVIDKAMAHWRSLAHLRGPVGSWPMERKESSIGHTFRLTKEEWKAVLRAARRMKVTPYVLVLTMYQMAIARVTGADGYIINGTIHDRSDPETIGMIGCFDSFIVMRGGVPADAPIESLLDDISERVQTTVDVAAVPASLSGPDDEGRLPYVASAPSVEFAMFETRDGLDIPGVRQRRFRLGYGHPSIRLTSCPVFGTERNFFFSSATASPEELAHLSDVFYDILMATSAPAD